MKIHTFLKHRGFTGASVDLPEDQTPEDLERAGWKQFAIRDLIEDKKNTAEMYKCQAVALCRSFLRGGFIKNSGIQRHAIEFDSDRKCWSAASSSWMR